MTDALAFPDQVFLDARAERIRALAKRVIADVIEIGRLLAECKERCGHGNWLPWLEREFGWTDRTALNFMRVHEWSLKSETVSDLDLPMRSLYLLAAPSTPEAARAEVIARAEAGERLHQDEVKAIVAAYNKAAIEDAARIVHGKTGNTGVAMHPYAERGDEVYETPECAIRALLKVESFGPGAIWEPACCRGSLVRVLRETGRRVVATDINDYGCPDSQSGIDFLMQRRAPDGVDTVLTNPPCRFADEFVRHALTLAPRVMFLRFLFIESQGRCDLIDGKRLRRVYPFIDRLPMMHRDGWEGPRADDSPQIQFAWFVWDQSYRGDIVVRRIWGRERDSDEAAP
jgi:hypothetical protein